MRLCNSFTLNIVASSHDRSRRVSKAPETLTPSLTKLQTDSLSPSFHNCDTTPPTVFRSPRAHYWLGPSTGWGSRTVRVEERMWLADLCPPLRPIAAIWARFRLIA